MSTITKLIAEDVALKLTSQKLDSIKIIEHALQRSLCQMVQKGIPKEVVDCYVKYPDHFYTRTQVQLYGSGWDWVYLNLGKKLPIKTAVFTPNEKQSEELKALKLELDNANKNYKDLVSEIKTALFGLRTYKRVEENFPEAFVLLPSKTSSAIAVNISDIRQKIK